MAEDYRGSHTAPDRFENAPMYDLAQIYPPDIYNTKTQLRIYGGGGGDDYEKADRESFAVVNRVRNKPDADVIIYRAVPDVADQINKYDWVTPSLTYAKLHLEGPLNGEGKVLKKTVKAKDVWTNADSINEWGYDPE